MEADDHYRRQPVGQQPSLAACSTLVLKGAGINGMKVIRPPGPIMSNTG